MSVVNELAATFLESDREEMEARAKPSLSSGRHRMSAWGERCTRRLWYMVNCPEDGTPGDSYNGGRFWLGIVLERQIAERVQKALGERWKVQQLRDYVKIDRGPGLRLLGGYMDYIAVRKEDGAAVVLEIKTMNDRTRKHIRTWRDFIDADEFWLRRYPFQVMGYSVAGREKGYVTEEGGLLVGLGLPSGRISVWPVEMDLELYSTQMLKLTKVDKAGDDPDKIDAAGGRIPYNHGECSRCEFSHLCLPTMRGDAIRLSDDPRVLKLLEERRALIAAGVPQMARELKEVESLLKDLARLHGEGTVLCGEFALEVGKPRQSTTVKIPDEVREIWSVPVDRPAPVVIRDLMKGGKV